MVAEVRIAKEHEPFPMQGGRPALDLVNTLHERWRGGVELLAEPGDLAGWAGRAGLLAASASVDPTEAEALLPEIRTLREAIRLAAAAVQGDQAVAAPVLATLNAWLDQPRPQPHLAAGADGPILTMHSGQTPSPDQLTFVWGADGPMLTTQPLISPLRAAFVAVAEDAARLLGTPDRKRIRVCANPHCQAHFYDRSQAGRRRWCDMARCGNVAKVRRFRERLREG